MKKFSVVRFLNDKSLAVVPSSWLHETASINAEGLLQGKFYWPPDTYKGAKVNRAVMLEEEPTADFDVLEAVILKTKDSYEAARKLLPKAVRSDDLESSDQDRGRGKRVKVQRRISSSEESDANSDSELQHVPPKRSPPPPPLPPPTMKQRSVLSRIQGRVPPTGSRLAATAATKSNSGPLVRDTSSCKENSSQQCSPPRSLPLSPDRSSENDCVDIPDHEVSWVSSQTSSDVRICEETTSLVYSTQVTIRAVLRELNTIKDQNHTIMTMLKERATGVLGMAATPEIPSEDLPLVTVEELRLFESRLDDHQFRQNFVTALSYAGGKDLRPKVAAIMRKLITDDLGLKYSCFGAKGKKAFCALKLYSVLKDAVRRNRVTAHATDKEIEDSVRRWLKNCTTRLGKKLKEYSDNDLPSA